MEGKTKIIIKAVVIPLGFLILILTIFTIFLLKCRRDRKKDEREGLNHSFSPYEAWQTQVAQSPQNQWPLNQNQDPYQYPMSSPQMQRPPPVAVPPPYHSSIDHKSYV